MNTYDFEDDLRRHSPRLERIDYNYKPRQSPVPTPQRRRRGSDAKRDRSDTSTSGGKDRRRFAKKKRPSQADYVLLRQLEPNRPDIAHEARQRPSDSESSSDLVDDSNDEAEMTKRIEGQAPSSSNFRHVQVVTESSGTPQLPAEVSQTCAARAGPVSDRIGQQDALRKDSNMSESIATSPTLQQHLIEPSQRPADQQLAAFNAEPSPTSGDVKNQPLSDASLPSIRNILHDINKNVPNANTYERTNSAPEPIGPRHSISQPFTYAPRSSTDPHSRRPSDIFPGHLPSRNNSLLVQSPVAYGTGTRLSYGRITDPSPTSATFSRASVSSARSQTTAGSTTEGFSPTSQAPVEPHQAIKGRRLTLPASTPPPGPSAAGPAGGYKCTFDGCKAQPFQTQYLLNSHANVHSQERPHYCAVQGCPRSEGGKGFKRKNEMIRHGLVHSSPGYVCPFCPDKEHRYPRPDNLQRHVRMHHEDMNKDDPALREVLALRTFGGHRQGRRRRT